LSHIENIAASLIAAWLALGCNAIAGITEASPRPASSATGLSGAAGPSSVPLGGACTTHAQCLAASGEYDPAACIHGACAKLFTHDCPLAIPLSNNQWLQNLRSKDAEPFIFGVFSYVQPPNLFGNEVRNYDLALTELTQAVGGLPTANGKRRPLLAVVCRDPSGDTETLDQEVDHLALDLDVTAVLAGLDADELEHAFRHRGYDHDDFYLSPFGAEQNLIDLLDDGLVWNMLGPSTDQIPVYQPLLDRTLAHLRAQGTLGQDEPARVALVTARDVRAFSDLSDGLIAAPLTFNGRSASDNAPDHFLAVDITSASHSLSRLSGTDTIAKTPDYSGAIQSLHDFRPHVVISAATSEFVDDIVPLLETSGLDIKPTYLLSFWSYNQGSLQTLVAPPPPTDLSTRILGVNYAAAPDQSVYDAYLGRFKAAYRNTPPAAGYENHYDTAYFLAFAAVGAGMGESIGGHDMVRGMRRLLSGSTELEVGPGEANSVLLALATPETSIQLDGAMGPPNFDTTTGVRHSPGSVWCIDAGGNFLADVLTLDPTGALVGTVPSSCGF
jgi:hypothetical protein